MRNAARRLPAVMVLLIAAPGAAREVPFAAEATIDTATPTSDLRYADVDGDGDIDGIAVAGGDIVWYDNTAGDGSAWATRIIDPFDSTQTPLRVFPADVDGDGDIDVFSIWRRTVPFTSELISWHENTAGDGSAWLRSTSSIGSSPSSLDSIFAADMDRDGDVDVVSGGDLASQGIRWWENRLEDGLLWTVNNVGACANRNKGLTVADIDGDADPDIFALCDHDNGDEYVEWYENAAGTGLTWMIEIFDPSWYSPNYGNQNLLALDADADGDLDLASTVVYASEKETIFLNLSGDFTSRSLSYLPLSPPSYNVSTYSAGDIDQDGDVDLLTTGSTPAPPTSVEVLNWWESTGPDPTTWTGHPVEGSGVHSSAAFATDLDGDGDLDMLAALSDTNGFTNFTAWYENRTIHRSASFPEQQVITSSAGDPIGVAVADIDGDSDLDVISASQGSDAIAWYENDGASPPSFTARTIASGADVVRWIAAADIDRDGDVDVVGGHAGRFPRLNWYESDGASPPAWTTRTISIVGSNAPVATGDLDDDGDPDVVAGSAWYENDGSVPPVWTQRSYPASNVQSVATADVNRDGRLDIISTTLSKDSVSWYENDGASPPAFTARLIDDKLALPAAALPADVDRDGDIDIVACAFDDDIINWYKNSGGSLPSWTASTITSAADRVVSVFPADLDGDGDVDVVGGTGGSGIVWYEHDGASPPAWTPHAIIASTGNNFRAVAGDLDDDGDVDVVSTDAGGNSVAWYPNRGGQFRLTTTDTSPQTLLEGSRDDVLSIDITHNGRSGDSDLEVASIELRFDDAGGVPLTTSEASALLARIGAWAELGTPGYWDPASDLLVTELTSFTLTDGRLTIALTDGDPLVQLPSGMTATGYIVLDAAAGGASQTPNQFRVTHMTESSTSAEDAPHDIPLTLEFAPDVTTQLITVAPEPGELILLLTGGVFLLALERRRAAGRRVRYVSHRASGGSQARQRGPSL